MRGPTTLRIWRHWKASMLVFAGIYIGDAIRSSMWIPLVCSLIWLALFYWARRIEVVDVNELRARTAELRALTDEIKLMRQRLSPERN